MAQYLFLTETAQLADVVLPAATWGEKTGTFTNADRTVRLSDKAVEPPGEAKPVSDASPFQLTTGQLHPGTAGNSPHWVMLSQAAQASKGTRRLDAVSFCRPRTLRQMHWSTIMIKNLSPQLLTAGDEQDG